MKKLWFSADSSASIIFSINFEFLRFFPRLFRKNHWFFLLNYKKYWLLKAGAICEKSFKMFGIYIPEFKSKRLNTKQNWVYCTEFVDFFNFKLLFLINFNNFIKNKHFKFFLNMPDIDSLPHCLSLRLMGLLFPKGW